MQIKGLVLRAREQFVREHFGEEAWKHVLDALGEEDRAVLQRLVITGRWYPFEIGSRLDTAIVEVLGGGDENVFEEIGAMSARRSLTKVHRSFLAPGDPQAFMKKADLIYRFYYDTGRREYTQTGPHSGVMTTHESESYSEPDCLTVMGWYKEALGMCGARNVRVEEEECRAKGGTCCRYRFRWEM